jgi:thioredoxin 1
MKGSLNDLINGSKPVLVDFHADWCGPCKMQAPILKQVSEEMSDKARIIKIDVDKNPAVAAQFEVRGVPTLIMFKNGKAVWRQSGVVGKDQLKQVISKFA